MFISGEIGCWKLTDLSNVTLMFTDYATMAPAACITSCWNITNAAVIIVSDCVICMIHYLNTHFNSCFLFCYILSLFCSTFIYIYTLLHRIYITITTLQLRIEGTNYLSIFYILTYRQQVNSEKKCVQGVKNNSIGMYIIYMLIYSCN